MEVKGSALILYAFFFSTEKSHVGFKRVDVMDVNVSFEFCDRKVLLKSQGKCYYTTIRLEILCTGK